VNGSRFGWAKTRYSTRNVHRNAHSDTLCSATDWTAASEYFDPSIATKTRMLSLPNTGWERHPSPRLSVTFSLRGLPVNLPLSSGWFVQPAAAGTSESCVELRLRCAMTARRMRWVRSSLLSLLAFDRLLQCSPAQERA
jgi:hypothetical protein